MSRLIDVSRRHPAGRRYPGREGVRCGTRQSEPSNETSFPFIKLDHPPKQQAVAACAPVGTSAIQRACLAAAVLLIAALGFTRALAGPVENMRLATGHGTWQLPTLLTPVRARASIPMPRTYPIAISTIRYRPQQRIEQLVRPELFPYFDLYLYVNKAPQGISAQHMYIYERLPNGNFHLRYRWATSTGRERSERYFTTTPTGIYKLDPGRFYTFYRSRVWDGVPMPYAMFLDFSYDSGGTSGIAIHGTNARRNLGYRASGGCIRLALENARHLFSLIQAHYGGNVPKFAWDSANGSTSRTGQLRRGPDGDVVLERGYRVLVIVDDTASINSNISNAN